MIITADRKALSAAITRAAQGIGTRPVKPVHAGMLIEVSREAGVRLTGGDDDVSFAAQLNGTLDVREEGSVILPGKMLNDITKYWTKDEVTIEAEPPLATVITSGSRFTLSCQDGEYYPSWTAPPPPLGQLGAEEFSDAVKKVIPAASDVEDLLKTVMIAIESDHLLMVSTDRYKMAVMSPELRSVSLFADAGNFPPQVLIPNWIFSRFARVTGSEVSFGWNDKLIMLGTEGLNVTARQFGGTFIAKWRQVMDSEPARCCTADTADLLRAVRMAQLASGDGDGIEMAFISEGNIAVSAKGDKGSSVTDVPCDYQGEDITFAFGAQMVIDALGACEDSADLAFSTPLAPLFLRSEGLRFMLKPRREL